MGMLNFQAIQEVKKPLASAAAIPNKGNIIVFDCDGFDRYIPNKVTTKKTNHLQVTADYVKTLSPQTIAEYLNGKSASGFIKAMAENEHGIGTVGQGWAKAREAGIIKRGRSESVGEGHA